jgi:hypothetical protein
MRYSLVLLCLSGCSMVRFKTPTTPAPMPDMAPLYPHEVQYELLGNVVGDACEGVWTPTEEIVEAAKFEALHQTPTADGLMAVRYKAETSFPKKCVTLIARAYRIVSVRARMPECQAAAMHVEASQPQQPPAADPLGAPWPR